LFNEKDLSGWQANENPKSFRVEGGLLVCTGERSHLFYETGEPFRNFEMIEEMQ